MWVNRDTHSIHSKLHLGIVLKTLVGCECFSFVIALYRKQKGGAKCTPPYINMLLSSVSLLIALPIVLLSPLLKFFEIE